MAEVDYPLVCCEVWRQTNLNGGHKVSAVTVYASTMMGHGTGLLWAHYVRWRFDSAHSTSEF